MKYNRYILALILVTAALLGACENPADNDDGDLIFPFGPTAGIGNAAWSNSGDLITYGAIYDDSGEFVSDLYLTDTTGGPRIPMGIDGSVFHWLKGDSVLLVNIGGFLGGSIVFFNRFTKEVKPVGISTRLPLFDISQDERFIYFTGEPVDSLWSSGIYRFDINDSSTTFIVDGDSPAISPDGLKLAFKRGGVSVIDLATNIVTVLFLDGGDRSTPEWSPGGKFIALEASVDGATNRILKTDLSGQLSFILNGNGPLRISPSGQKLLFYKRDSTQVEHIWMANMDGTNVKKISR